MRNWKTTLAGYVGLASNLALVAAGVSAACGQFAICGAVGLGGLLLGNLARDVGNILSQDGSH